MILFLGGKVYNSFSKKKVRRGSVRTTLNCQNKLRFFFLRWMVFFIDLNVNFSDPEKVMSSIVVIRDKSRRFTAWEIKLALKLKLYIVVRSAV